MFLGKNTHVGKPPDNRVSIGFKVFEACHASTCNLSGNMPLATWKMKKLASSHLEPPIQSAKNDQAPYAASLFPGAAENSLEAMAKPAFQAASSVEYPNPLRHGLCLVNLAMRECSTLKISAALIEDNPCLFAALPWHREELASFRGRRANIKRACTILMQQARL